MKNKEKKPKRKASVGGCFGAILEMLGEILGELLIVLLFTVAGLPLYFLLPKSFVEKLEFDDLILLGFPLILFIVAAVFFINHIHDKKKQQRHAVNKQRYCKAFHRGYGDIYALYDDLKDTVRDIDIKDSAITVRYRTLTMVIVKVLDGYRTRINDSKDTVIQPDETIHQYVMEFVREERSSNEILAISDDRIESVTPRGLIYADVFDRRFSIDFSECAYEYERDRYANVSAQFQHIPQNCVGEFSPDNCSILLWTPAMKTQIDFDAPLIMTKHSHLRGFRKKRMVILKKIIREKGYTLHTP